MLKNNVQMYNATGAWLSVAAGSPSAKEDKQHKTKMTFGQNRIIKSLPSGGLKIFQS